VNLAGRIDVSVRYGILMIASLLTVAPLVVVGITAFYKPNTAITGIAIPHDFNWQTFGNAWHTGGFPQALQSSGVTAVSVVTVVTALSILAGYAFGTMEFPGNNALFYTMLVGVTVPFEAMIVPMYFDFQKFHLTNTVWSLILPESGIYLAFGVFWMRAFFKSVPMSIVEAARMDGASSFAILVRILIPIGRPVILTLMMLTFLSSWNEYLTPLVMVSSNNLQTLPVALAGFQGQYQTDVPSMAAASIIVAGPAILVYIFTQRSFFRGLLQGAVK
jgi:raffinose/stachyose/melibiose transport system permease protein